MACNTEKIERSENKDKSCSLQKRVRVKEIVLDIDGYKYKLLVFSNGIIKRAEQRLNNTKRIFKEMVLSPHDGATGYNSIMVNANKKYKRYYIHNLVATAFLDNPNNLKEVDHLDSDRDNNDVSNLEWVSRKENIRRSLNNNKNRISYDEYKEILFDFFCKGKEIKKIAKCRNLNTPNTISGIVNGNIYRQYYSYIFNDKYVCKELLKRFRDKQRRSTAIKYDKLYG